MTTKYWHSYKSPSIAKHWCHTIVNFYTRLELYQGCKGTPLWDPTLDEEIEIPKFDYATMSLEQINIMQQAWERKKNQEILRKEYKQRQALHEIKDIFLDAFSLQTPTETKPILEQLTDSIEQVTNED